MHTDVIHMVHIMTWMITNILHKLARSHNQIKNSDEQPLWGWPYTCTSLVSFRAEEDEKVAKSVMKDLDTEDAVRRLQKEVTDEVSGVRM